jgi:Na+/alanine symporter
MREFLNYLLGGIVWVFAFIVVAGCCVEAFLLFRYPGLNDPSSGPAYYWPKDAFQIIGTGCFVVFVFFCIFFMIYQTQKAKTPNRSKVPGTE